MMRILQLLDEVFYGLGVMGLIGVALLKLGIVDSALLLNTNTRGALLFSGVMFLAVIATKSIVVEEPASKA